MPDFIGIRQCGKNIKVPSDVIVYSFSCLNLGTRFPYDMPRMHRFFHEASRDDDFLGLFYEYVFKNSGHQPYCRSVDQAINRMLKASLLNLVGDCRTLMVSKKLKGKDPAELFSARDTRMLKNLAKMFIEKYIKMRA